MHFGFRGLAVAKGFLGPRVFLRGYTGLVGLFIL